MSTNPSESKVPAIPPAPGSRSNVAREYDFFKVVQDYLDRAAKAVNIEPFVRTILSQPKNELIINFPVKMTTARSASSRATASSTTTCSARSRAACATTRRSPSTTSRRSRR